MAITLVVNPGSTSRKYGLYENERAVFSMRFEETGDGFGMCVEKNGESQKCADVDAKVFNDAIHVFLEEAVKHRAVSSAKDIDGVGVRVVAPGSFFTAHAQITDEYMAQLEAFSDVAPLHIPSIVREIYAVKTGIPHVPLYAISDSAFHTSIPSHRRTFSINQKDREEYDIRRYGYHGISMSAVARRTESFFGVAPDRVVALHVGGGVSATALHYQESVDTSMGYSPASGIMMNSRAGDFDADALIALMAKKGIRSIETLSRYINTECGFKGMVGYADLRLVLQKYTEGDPHAVLALEVFRYNLHRQIGGHIALLGGLDAFVFTGTAVERNPFIRTYILDGLSGFGLLLDEEKNDSLVSSEGMIHSDRGEVSVGVMKSDEMGEIARITASHLYANPSGSK